MKALSNKAFKGCKDETVPQLLVCHDSVVRKSEIYSQILISLELDLDMHNVETLAKEVLRC